MLVSRNLNLRIIWQSTRRSVLFFLFLGLLVPMLHDGLAIAWLQVPISVVGSLGTALAIFLAFRNSSAYDRWWEARKLWGALVNNSRSFARQVLTTVGPPVDAGDDVVALRRRLVLGQIAFCHALRLHLRKQNQEMQAAVGPFLDADVAARALTAKNVPAAIVLAQAQALARARADGLVDGLHHVELDRTLGALIDVQGACERIKNTPFPRQYDYYPRIFVYVYAFFLPFAFVQDLGYMTPILSVPTSFLFYALMRLGALNEDPFENRITDTPLTALCRTIEQNLKEALGDRDLPEALQPVDGFLY